MLFLLLMAAYGLIALRLGYLQVVRAAWYRQEAERTHTRDITVPAHRGIIRDTNGEELAINDDAATVSVDPSFYWDSKKYPLLRDETGKRRRVAPNREASAAAIAGILNLKKEDVLKKLNSRGYYQLLKRRVPLEVARRLRLADIAGINVDDEPKRVYPMGTLAGHVLGFTDLDGVGREGIEGVHEEALRRHDGVERHEVDRVGRIIPGTLHEARPPVDGADVTLTIDARIQQAAERELNAACSKYTAKAGTCVVIDPRTGYVLAMANYPPFDPNAPRPRKPEAWRNRAVTDTYEPGSTHKGITACAALDTGVVSTTRIINCPAAITFGNHTIHDVTHGHGAFGPQTLGGVLAHSSNTGMSQVGNWLGPRRLDAYIRSFGLLSKSGIGLPGESATSLPRPETWSKHFTATVAFGQSISYTPLRLAAAYAAIANKGLLMRPQIVKQVRYPATPTEPARTRTFPPVPVRQVIKPETAATVTRLLSQVVTDGTGKPAKVRGYQLVGKTGSAQKVVEGRYVPGKFVASFIGYLPASNPRAVILVTVDEPHGTHWGAVAAAPVFREVARQTMWFLNVPPDDPNDVFDGSDPSTWNRQRVAKRR
jgi:stage V sporulation protein D (sporulation-specific penicillin-binding protein)